MNAGVGTSSRAAMAGETRRALTLTMVALALILIGLTGIGHRDGGWPIVTWPMYSTYVPEMPPSIASRYELRVVDVDGNSRTFSVFDFAPAGWIKAAGQVFRSAYQDSVPAQRDSSRAYIVRVVAQTVALARIARIEGWRRDWACDPLATPPIDYAHPLSDVRLGDFAASTYVPGARP